MSLFVLVRPHSVTHCVLWPSHSSLNVPYCSLPLMHTALPKHSSAGRRWAATIPSIFFLLLSFLRPTCTHASMVNESHVHSLLPLPPRLSSELAHSCAVANALTCGRHYRHDSEHNSRLRQRKLFAPNGSVCLHLGIKLNIFDFSSGFNSKK